MRNLTTVAVLLLFLAGCDPRTPTTTNPPAKKETVVLTVASNSPPESAEHRALARLSTLLADRTQGTVTLSLLPEAQTPPPRELAAAVQKGDIDIALVPSAKLTHLVPSFELLDVPFLLQDHRQVRRIYDSDASHQLLNMLEPHGLVGLALWDGGFKHLITTFPLQQKQDFERRRFRIMESTLLRQQFEFWGATTIPVAEQRVEEAFNNGDIDGEEETLRNIRLEDLKGKHLTLTHHGHRNDVLIISAIALAQLPSSAVTALEQSTADATNYQYTLANEQHHETEAMLKRADNVKTPPPALLAELKAASKPLLERNRHRFGTELVEQLIQAREDWDNPHPGKLVVALDADLTGSAALSGLAIRRGIELALEEINAKGGILGKEVVLMARDNAMVPSRGIDNIEVLSKIPNLLAVFSGISSPVVLAELDLLHQRKMLMLIPWAAATPIVSNGQDPNFVFRVSVRDEYAAQFLLDGALAVSDNVGFLLVNNGWGRSNYEGLIDAMSARGMKPVQTEWFDWGERSMTIKIKSLIDRGAEAIVFVGNAVEGQKFITELSSFPNPPTVFSHWGITGSEFAARTAHALEKVDLRVLQTFTFVDNDSPVAQALAKRYHQQYGTRNSTDIFAPSGTAHAYDLMHMLALATERAGSADTAKVQKALAELDSYRGLMKDYINPFKNGPQDALTTDDYLFTLYKNGTLHPVEVTP